MKKEKNVIGIVALIVAIVGLSVGFAAFTSTITVATTGTYTPPSSDWNVAFSCTPTATVAGSATCGKGTVSGTTWSGLTATLVKPGDACTWTCSIKNSGKYTAYLNAVSGGAISACTPAATSDLATSACSDITFTKTPSSASGSIAAGGTQTVTLKLTYGGDVYTDESITITISDLTYKYESRD